MIQISITVPALSLRFISGLTGLTPAPLIVKRRFGQLAPLHWTRTFAPAGMPLTLKLERIVHFAVAA